MSTAHATEAALIKATLKVAFPGVRFSVRTGRGTGSTWIDCQWTDGPTEDAVRQVANYRPGYGGLSLTRTYSAEAMAWAASLIRTNAAGERFIRNPAGRDVWQWTPWCEDSQIARSWLCGVASIDYPRELAVA